MPDFVGFDQYQQANGDEEKRLMEEAYARAEAADQKARQALQRSQTDAQRGRQRAINRQDELYYANNRGRAGQGLSVDAPQEMGGDLPTMQQTGSYSDYLAAKQDAARQWASISRQSSNPYEQGLRDSLGGKTQGDNAELAASALDERGRRAEFNDAEAATNARGANLKRQQGWAAEQQGVVDQRNADRARTQDFLRNMGDPTTWADDFHKAPGAWQDQQARAQTWNRVNASLGGSANTPQAIAARRYAASNRFLSNAWTPNGPGSGPKGPGIGFSFGGTAYDENGQQRGNIVSTDEAQSRLQQQQRQDEDQRIKNSGSTGYLNPYDQSLYGKR